MAPKSEFMGEKVEEVSRIVFAGFGGQGILFLGKLLAYSGLIEQREVSWIPSYGPEMRGGTANCHVVISPFEIGSPTVSVPDVLVAMNRPSMERFVKDIKPGGYLFYNSSLIDVKPSRADIKIIAVPANEIAESLGDPGIANVVMCGAIVENTSVVQMKSIKMAMEKIVSSARVHLLELNHKALEAGRKCC
jgi:2-oxoglutarate ferredoxin oxidoreductase subunit gamma